MKKTKYSILLALLVVLVAGCSDTALDIQKLTVEYLEQPIGISTDAPRFGWVLSSDENGTFQCAYQISISKEEGEVWNTGKVVSNQSQLISYQGAQLQSGQRYNMEVTVWDQNDQPTKPQISWFEMAPSDLKAQWIGAIRREEANLPDGRNWHAPSLKKNRAFYDSIPDLAKRSIILQKEVSVEKQLKKATAYISGLGHYEFSLNGEKVGQSQFAPLWTDYDKSVFYNTYDLTESLKSGGNAIGVLLGNGMYNVIGDRYRKFWVSFGPPTLFFELRLEYVDGSMETILSDESWNFSESPITFNCIFGGEDYDARLEQAGWNQVDFDDVNWKPVVIQEAPKGKLKAQLAPAVEVQQQYEVKTASQLNDTIWVFDMGQNLSGFPTITVKGKSGQKIKLIVGERIRENGSVNQKNTGSPHFYEYTLKGGAEETWQPRFSYYGYQYIQVEGVHYGDGENSQNLPVLEDIKSNFIYSNATPIGNFECSNEIFTKTHTLINNAVKSNMQAVFTDCPHREKLGWLEEIHLVGLGLLYNYDLTQLLAKPMMDMEDAQRDNGLIPNIAPEYVDFSAESWGADFTDSPEWGAAVVMVPWQYYEFFGDASLIEKYYPVMVRYLDYLTSRAENGIVSHGLGDWYDYGEHGAGYSKNSPIALSATSHYYLCAENVAKAAQLLKKPTDQQQYEKLAESIKLAFNQEFFNPETKQYGTGSQFSNAVAIQMGLVAPENKAAVLANLVKDIEARGNRLTTGDVGNRYLFQALAENYLNELMYKMHNHHDAPGYGYQLQYGLTTLTEQWDPAKGNSWNHFMMGQIEEWFFKSLGGIVPDREAPGFKHFYIQPQLVGDLTYVKASTASLYGEISVDWKIENEAFIMKVKVPVNSTATFVLPERVEHEVREIALSSGVQRFSFPLKKSQK